MNEFDNETTLEWKSISFLHVEYQRGDFLGFVLAWISLFPFFILVGFATHIYFRREIHTIFYFCGLILNELINFVIKHIVKEARPNGGHSAVHVAYGWPSSHSQFAWFFVSYLILFISIRLQSNSSTTDMIWRHGMCVLSAIAATLVSYSRVYLLYHTAGQIFWGAVLGAFIGSLWFAFNHLVLAQFYYIITSWKLSEILMIRDSTLIPNIMYFEYATSRQESRSRSRKMSSSKVQ